MADTKIKAGQFFGVIGHGTDGYFLMTNADGSMSWAEGGSAGPSVTSVSYPGDDLAADPAGGQTVVLTGTNFGSSMTVSIGGTTAPSVAHDSSTQLTITTPAKAAGDYDIVVTNTVTGASGTFVNGISYNGVPTWTTAAGSLGTFDSETTISTITLQATETDGGTITFNITNGALPTGLSLTGANIDGTTTAESSTTLYSFTIEAIDDENQATPRNFFITVNSAAITPSENFTINTYTGNGSTQSIEGKIGTAASFNGQGSYILTSLNSSNIYALSFWLYFESGTTQYTPFGSDVSSGAGDISTELGTNGSFSITIQNKTYSAGSGALGSTGWKHIAYSSNQQLYINGVLHTGGTTITNSNPSANLLIGSWNNTFPSWGAFNSKLDQIRVFNRNLISSEVTTLAAESNTSTTKSTTDIFDDGSGVALYEFEEGAKDTGGVNGYIGSAGIFNSGSYIAHTFDAPVNLSWSLWINPDNFSASSWDSTDFWMISCGNDAISGSITALGLRSRSDGYIVFHRNSNDGGAIVSNTQMSAGQWNHIVVTQSNGSTAKIYLNGTEVASGTFSTIQSATISGNGGASNFASFSRSATYALLTGKIDQVRIFNKALSSSEVTTLYGETSASATKSTTDIFDDGSGVALYELEGNANDSGIDYGTSAIDSGQSAVFNGSNGVIDLGSNLGLANNSFSFSFWVANRATTAHSYFIGGGTQANNQGLHVGYRYNTGKFTLAFYANDLDSNTSMSNDGTWEHWACTYDATTNSRKIYYNGVLDALDTATADFQSTANIKLGLDPGNVYANGDLDDVRIYSDVLTDYEIKRIVANDTANIPTSNLTAHYKLNGNANDETGTYNGIASNITYTNPAEKPGLIRAYDGTATNVSYAYDGTPTNVNFLGMAFQPDLVWLKSRSDADHNVLLDSVRGGTNPLISNSTSAEVVDTDYIQSFDSNGFSIKYDSQRLDFSHNESGDPLVAWCWKAGGTAVSNTDGTITSQVSANQDAGFSIVSYVGTAANATVGHGLSSAPEFWIVKNRDTTDLWTAGVASLGGGKYFDFNTDSKAFSSGTPWNSTLPTSSVVHLGSYTGTNGSNDMIMYCFHSVDGYQKVGSYTADNQTTKNITTGFRPRFLLLKRTNSAQNWVLVDSLRSNNELYANTSGSEATEASIPTFYDDGFTLHNTRYNGGTDNYIYLAIA